MPAFAGSVILDFICSQTLLTANSLADLARPIVKYATKKINKNFQSAINVDSDLPIIGTNFI